MRRGIAAFGSATSHFASFRLIRSAFAPSPSGRPRPNRRPDQRPPPRRSRTRSAPDRHGSRNPGDLLHFDARRFRRFLHPERTVDGEPIPDGEGNLGVEAPDGSTTYYRVDSPRAIPVKRRDQYGGRLEVPAPRWRFWVICGFGPAGSGKPAGSAAAAWRAWRRGASEADLNATTARCYRAETWRAAEDADISAASGVAPDGGRWEGGE